jgi:regulator of sirC expression with transglutaminase-like and TPR domain
MNADYECARQALRQYLRDHPKRPTAEQIDENLDAISKIPEVLNELDKKR